MWIKNQLIKHGLPKPLFIAVILSALGLSFSERREEILSYQMWCLEMQFYTAERCEMRRTDDLKEYERYRASVERYQDQRTVKEKRNKSIEEKLNRDPLNPNRDEPRGAQGFAR